MLTSMKMPTLLSLALLAVAWSACGSAGAENQQAKQNENEPGFLERIFEPEPEPIEVPAGTLLALQLQETLSSHETPVGTTFTALVTQEVSVDGQVAIPAGSTVTGSVEEARAAEKVGGRAVLSLSFDSLSLPDGESVGIQAQLAQVGKSEAGKDAAIIGGSTIGGAILGEAIDEGEGTAVGAVVGGIAGTIGALRTRGKPVELAAGSRLQITLEQPIRLEERS